MARPTQRRPGLVGHRRRLWSGYGVGEPPARHRQKYRAARYHRLPIPPTSPAGCRHRLPIPPTLLAGGRYQCPDRPTIPPTSLAGGRHQCPDRPTIPPTLLAGGRYQCPDPPTIPPTLLAGGRYQCPDPPTIPPTLLAGGRYQCPDPPTIPPTSLAGRSPRHLDLHHHQNQTPRLGQYLVDPVLLPRCGCFHIDLTLDHVCDSHTIHHPHH